MDRPASVYITPAGDTHKRVRVCALTQRPLLSVVSRYDRERAAGDEEAQRSGGQTER